MNGTIKTRRMTVDLEAYPDLVVIQLGMRAQSLRGVITLLKIGPQIQKSVADKPDGLLLHENMLFSLMPLHLGMRQYWRDLDAMERWTRELPHKGWWVNFLRDPGGTAFWHETYSIRGGFEAIYDEVAEPVGMARFATVVPARGRLFSLRNRLRPGSDAPEAPIREQEMS